MSASLMILLSGVFPEEFIIKQLEETLLEYKNNKDKAVRSKLHAVCSILIIRLEIKLREEETKGSFQEATAALIKDFEQKEEWMKMNPELTKQ